MKRRKNNSGSIYERPDGRWTAELTVTGTDGKPKRKYVYGATEQDIEDKLSGVRKQERQHVPFGDERLTVGQWLQTWLRNNKPPKTKPKTWITYEGLVRLHLLPGLGDIALVKLQPQHVRDFIDQRLDSGLSVRTVQHLRAALRAALNQAVGDQMLTRNAAIIAKPPESEPRTHNVYTPAEAKRLIEAARGHRLEALFTAALAIALREGECLGLQWTDIDFASGRLTVCHNLQRVRRVRRGDVVKDGEARTERLLGSPKGKKPRVVALPQILIESLKRHRLRQQDEQVLAGPQLWKGDGSYVFTSTVGTPLEQRNLFRVFESLRTKAELRKIRFHDLRHSAASILIAQGVHAKAIQELLGHSSIQLTMDTYGYLFDQVKQETANEMDRALATETTVKTTVKPKLIRVK